jgi:hypothetical protein
LDFSSALIFICTLEYIPQLIPMVPPQSSNSYVFIPHYP